MTDYLEGRDLVPRDLDYKKKVTREMLFDSDNERFPTVTLGRPAYSYERSELFVEFDASDDPDYLGRAFIRWSAIQWLQMAVSRQMCDLCESIGQCMECNACEFDLSPFRFKGPCRFQERESRYLCEDCVSELESVVERAVEENPGPFMAREI